MSQLRRSTSILAFLIGCACLSYGQTPGFIFEPATDSSFTLDPDSNGFVSQSVWGFSNDGYDVDEFELTMFAFPTIGIGEKVTDLQSGPECGFTDFSVDTAGSAAYAGIDAWNNLIFRFRLASSAPNSKGYSVLIDTDQMVGSNDPNATSNNPGFEIVISLLTNKGVYIYNVDGLDNCSDQRVAYLGSGKYQKAATITGPCAAQDVFYDFYVPFSDLTTAFGITTSTPIRMIAVTNSFPACALEGSPSDLAGVDDNEYGGCIVCSWEDLVSVSPLMPVDSLCSTCSGFPPIRSDCPSIDEPISAGDTMFTGTSESNAKIIYAVYNSADSLLSIDSVFSDATGVWASNTIATPIASGDSIVVSAVAPGKTRNDNCHHAIADVTCTVPPLDNGSIAMDAKGFCGAIGNGIPGAEIRIYRNGNLINPGAGSPAPVIVAGDGSWIWKCNLNTGCNGGPNCQTAGVYLATQQSPGECESEPAVLCYNTIGTSAIPTITPPISVMGGTVRGIAVDSTTIYLYNNGSLIGTTVVDTTGNWEITGLSLSRCDSITARGSTGTLCISPVSPSVTVSESSLPPTLQCDYGCGDTRISGEATGELGDMVLIALFDVSVSDTIYDTAYLTAYNNWIHTLSQPLDVYDSLKVKILPTCGSLSNYSTACVVPDTTQSPVVDCSLNYTEGDTIVSGTHPIDGVRITVLIDDDVIDTTSVAAGTWTLIVDPFTLYTGGTINAFAEDGINGRSKRSNSCEVACNLPDPNILLTYSNGDIMYGDIATLNLSASETGVFYELYDVEGQQAAGPTTYGTGAPIDLNSFALYDTARFVARAFRLPPTCEFIAMDSITVNVIPQPSSNQPPVAQNDSALVWVDSLVAISITANDTDPDGNLDPSSVSVLTGFGPSDGTATPVPAGSINYDPNPGFSGLDTFAYMICDSGSPPLCDTGLVIIRVLGPEICDNGFDDDGNGLVDCADSACIGAPPGTISPSTPTICKNDGASVHSIASVAGAISYNWTVPSGAIILNGQGDTTIFVDWTMAAQGVDSVCVAVGYACGPSQASCRSFVIAYCNNPPVAVDDFDTTSEDNMVAIDVLANDTDTDGNITASSVAVIAAPSSGTTLVNPVTGVLTYTPDADFYGTDSFTYRVCDSTLLCDSAVVSILVNPVNDAPVATNDTFSMPEDSMITVNPISNDTDPENNLDPGSVQVIDGPGNGVFVVDPLSGQILYIPNAEFNGTDSMTYVLCDNTMLCDSATILIAILSVNDAPVALTDHAIVSSYDTAIIDVLANDLDIEGDVDHSSVAVVNAPAGGSVSIDPLTGIIIYTPDPGFSGTDTFSYMVCDNATPALCDTGLIVVEVQLPNQAPDAVEDVAMTVVGQAVTIDVMANDTDPEGNGLMVSGIASVPLNGAVVINPDGTITYTPDAGFSGMDRFAYIICDDGIPQECDTGLVTVTVNGLSANDDQATTNATVIVDIPVLENDGLPDGMDTTITISMEPSVGSATVNPDGSITYTPDRFGNGMDSLQYVVCVQVDSALLVCDRAFVFVDVEPQPVELTSGFSPNNDGVNDFMGLSGLQSFPKAELHVYNRYGDEVWNSNGPYLNNWGGTNFNGKPLPDGTYYYIIYFNDGKTEPEASFVQIQRGRTN